jgi:serine/threonine protein kinase
MEAQPNPAAAEPQIGEDANQLLFPILNGYLEVLLQGRETNLMHWLRAHPEARDVLPDLQALEVLHDAGRVLDEDSRLDRTAAESPGGTAKETTRSLLPQGTQLGKYRIERLLGYGGMSEVYLAYQEMVERKVAVKVLPAHQADAPEAIHRFRKEIKAQGRMNPHPNIAAVFDADVYEGRVYCVMEYVAGTDLKTHVEQSGPPDPIQACAYIRQAAVGLQHAHQSGIIHRDIKPSNLMLTPDGTIKIVDLGLARLTSGEPPSGDSAPTAAGVLLGTVDFMAPEQADNAAQANFRSDLYSLGCTFYYLLTGYPPFNTGSPLQRLRAHALQPPPPIRQLRPDVPVAVSAVVDHLLRKRPEDRYASARALIQALDSASATGTGTRRLRPRWLLGVGAATVLVALLLALFWGKDWKSASEPPSAGPAPVAPEPERQPEVDVHVSQKARLYRLDENGQFLDLGWIGHSSSPPRLQDRIRIEARFSVPVYPYLIAINPDGKCDLLFPQDDSLRPMGEFHAPASVEGVYILDEVGFTSFVLVAARRPLLPFAEWQPTMDAAVWKEAEPREPWEFDGRWVQPLATQRVGEVPIGPKPFADVCAALKARASIAAVRGVAFSVQPKLR